MAAYLVKIKELKLLFIQIVQRRPHNSPPLAARPEPSNTKMHKLRPQSLDEGPVVDAWYVKVEPLPTHSGRIRRPGNIEILVLARVRVKFEVFGIIAEYVHMRIVTRGLGFATKIDYCLGE